MNITKIKNNISNLIKSKYKNKKIKLVLGLSGGPDSVFLFHILMEMQKENSLELICAHLDHEWRKESKKDLDFCINLARKNNIKIFTSSASQLNINIKYNGSKEDLGRKLRHHFFEKIRSEQNCDFIATAHHMQDNIETFFIRLIRGCSITGIIGINEINGRYFRPILNLDKNKILDYLNKNQIKYMIDKTNESNRFLRNRIRKYILPSLAKADVRSNKKILTSMNNLRQANSFLQKIVLEKFDKIFKLNYKNKFTGNLKLFHKQDPFLQKELIIYWLIQEKINFNPSSAFILEVLRFLNSNRGGSHKINSSISIHKKKNNFWTNQS